MQDKNKEPLQMMSLNANGLRNGVKRRSLFNWLKQFHNGKSKITFLQETHADKKVEKAWENEWGGEVLFANSTSGSKGIAILLPINMEYKVVFFLFFLITHHSLIIQHSSHINH